MDAETTDAPETRREPDTLFQRLAAFEPTTFDADSRTVELVWTTGAEVTRRDVWTNEKWVERLAVTDAAVDLSRLNAGAPVLNSHSQWSLADVIGVVERAWIEKGKGHAKVRFSDRPEVQPIVRDVQAGILRNISVGYRVDQWKDTPPSDRQPVRVREAVRWVPHEISLVPVPADAGAQVRSDPAGAADTPEASTRGVAPLNPEARMSEAVTQPGAQAPAPQPAVDIEAVRQEAIAAERSRLAGIDGVLTAAAALLPEEVRASLRAEAMTGGLSVDAVRARAFEVAAERARGGAAAPAISPVQTVRMGPSGDDPVVLRDAMADALAVQIRSTYKPQTDRHREWSGVRISDMARELLAARGERDVPRNRVALAERSFHSTSDFPLLLSSALNKVLLSDYALAEPTYRMFMARRTFNDFRPHSFLRVGDFPALSALAEGGQITLGTISEGREQITMATYARGVRVTRQMLINDELGAFNDFAGMIGRRILDFENATAFAQVTTGSGAGPNLADGSAVFTTGRGNRSASGAAIDVTSLGAARQALRNRTSPDGLKLNLSGRYLLTGPAYETIAWQFTSAQYVPATAATTNPFRGTYEPIVDANITGNNWYLFADPAVAPVYVYGFLSGAEGPQTRITNPPGTDGAVSVDVWLDFACGAIDWRGGQFNAGA
jgi:hypothetical protein